VTLTSHTQGWVYRQVSLARAAAGIVENQRVDIDDTVFGAVDTIP
jgi:hypothetical protein